MKKLFAVMSVVALAGCSSNYYQRPESISSKMERYKSKNQNENIVPEIEVAQVSFNQKIERTRTPASNNVENLPQNNKKFYFLTLLDQYQKMGTYLPKDHQLPEVNYCPHFHSSLVDFKENQIGSKRISRLFNQNKNLTWDNVTSLDITKYPELTLPLSETSKHPRVVDILRSAEKNEQYNNPQELIYHAMKLHLTKTYKELTTLCEYGNSANYYHYENLLGHIERKGGQFGAVSESIKILLKTTLYSNMTLLNSFEATQVQSGRVPASSESIYHNAYHGELLKRFNAPWAINYLKAVR